MGTVNVLGEPLKFAPKSTHAPGAGTGFVYLLRPSAKVAKQRREKRNAEEKRFRACPLKRLKSGKIGRYFGKVMTTTTKCDFE